MKARRKLDALVAEEVMGLPLAKHCENIYWPEGDGHHYHARVPHYTTDLSDALKVVHKVGVDMGLVLSVDYGIARSHTAPHAICLAALKAVGVEVEDA